MCGSPVNPSGQEHEKLPGEFQHMAPRPQELGSRHSSMSVKKGGSIQWIRRSSHTMTRWEHLRETRCFIYYLKEMLLEHGNKTNGMDDKLIVVQSFPLREYTLTSEYNPFPSKSSLFILTTQHPLHYINPLCPEHYKGCFFIPELLWTLSRQEYNRNSFFWGMWSIQRNNSLSTRSLYKKYRGIIIKRERKRMTAK